MFLYQVRSENTISAAWTCSGISSKLSLLDSIPYDIMWLK